MISDKNKYGNAKKLFSYMMKLFIIGTLIILIPIFFGGLRIAIMLLPVVVLLSTVSGGMVYGLGCSVLLMMFSFVLETSSSGMLYQMVGILSIVGLLLGIGIRREHSSNKVIFLTTFFVVSLIAVFSFYYHRMTGIRLTEGLILEYKKIFEMNPEILSQIRSSFDVSEQLVISEFFTKIQLLLPTVTFVIVLFICMLNYFVGASVLNRRIKMKKYPIFTEFCLPGNANLGIGLVFLTGYLFRKLQTDYSYNISVTMIYLAMILLYLQGTASILYWCRKKFSVLVGNLMWILSCIFAPWVVIFVGFFDIMFHLRKIDEGGIK